MGATKQRSVADVLKGLQLRRNQKLPPELRERVHDHLARETKLTFATAFVREAMRAAPDEEAERADHWAQTIVALSKAGRQYSIGDTAFRATLKLFQTPWLLAACQAGAVAQAAPLVVDAALAHDGSEASYDALLAELARAKLDQDDWSLRYKLKRLGKYAQKTPAWAALEQAVEAELEARAGRKAQHSTARELGLHVPLLKMWFELPGLVKPEGRVTWYLNIDDRRQRAVQSQVFPFRDVKDAPSVSALPKWLAQLTTQRQVTWRWAEARVHSNLRGQYAGAFVAWLRGERASPAVDARRAKKPR